MTFRDIIRHVVIIAATLSLIQITAAAAAAAEVSPPNEQNESSHIPPTTTIIARRSTTATTSAKMNTHRRRDRRRRLQQQQTKVLKQDRFQNTETMMKTNTNTRTKTSNEKYKTTQKKQQKLPPKRIRTTNTETRQQPHPRRPPEENESSGDETTTINNDPNEKKSAVAILLSNTDGDFIDLCLALRSLNAYNVIPTTSRIYIFVEKSFPPSRKADVAKCTANPLSFQYARLGSHFLRTKAEDVAAMATSNERQRQGLSPADDVSASSPPESTLWNTAVANMGSSLGRKKWGYVESIRFWTTLVWKHPALSNYDTIMRIDTDSCFTAPPSDVNVGYEDGISYGIADANRYLPGLPPGDIVYRSTGPMALGSNVWVTNLYDFAISYMTTNDITPSHPQLWNEIRTAWETQGTLPVFRKNFEIMDRHFFRRYDVMSWHEALTEREPYGVLRYRWGEAQTRVLTMAMFATRESVLVGDGYEGYRHGRGECAKFLGVTSGW